MSANYVADSGSQFIFYIGLTSQADVKLLQVNPTLAAGDAKVSIDGGAFNNLTTIPAVTPAGGRAVKVTLSAAEMTGTNIFVQLVDAAGAEWCDNFVNVSTTPAPANLRQIDGSLTNGNNANLKLRSLDIQNSAGHAIIAYGGSNGSGIVVTGNGTASGISSTGGATGHGMTLIGGATSGSGLNSQATAGNSNGLQSFGQGSGNGVGVQGGTTGNGIAAVGGATSGDGCNFLATTFGSGLSLTGNGAGSSGLLTTSSATNGNGIYAQGTGNSHGFVTVGGATGVGFLAEGGVTSGEGAYFLARGGGTGLKVVGVGDVSIYAPQGISGALDASVYTSIADALLKRDMSSVTGEASRSLLNCLRFLRNKWSFSGNTMTITKEDDSTLAWTATVSTDAAAVPIVQFVGN